MSFDICNICHKPVVESNWMFAARGGKVHIDCREEEIQNMQRRITPQFNGEVVCGDCKRYQRLACPCRRKDPKEEYSASSIARNCTKFAGSSVASVSYSVPVVEAVV